MRQRIKIFGGILCALGVIGFLSGAYFSLCNEPGNLSSFEFPLGAAEGIAVDSSGNIYCGAQFYGRVQKYDSKRCFLFAIEVHSNGGPFRIRVNENDELEVATARENEYCRFSPQGDLLQHRKEPIDIYEEFGPKQDYACKGPDGADYRLGVFPRIFPSIIKYTKEGEYSTVVSVPFYLWIVMGPFPAWLYIPAGGLMIKFAEKLDKEEAGLKTVKTESEQESLPQE